jgi:hypothetical protein
MNRTPVKSSSIRSVGYDDSSSLLEIEFNNGGIYQYLTVPKSAYDSLIAAASKGKYFDQLIKDRYRTVKVR